MADDAPLTSAEIIGSALPGILDRARVVITPYPFGVSDADRLRVVVFNSLPGVVVEIHGRQAAPGFDAKPFNLLLVPTSDRMATTQDFAIGGGFVTNVSVFASGATPLIGQTFVIVQLIRSAGATAFIMGTLLQGYITARQNVGWPGSPIQTSIEGGGYPREITGAMPAAGADFLETVPAGARWELQMFHAIIHTSAVVATRIPQLNAQVGGFAKAFVPSPVGVGAGLVGFFCWQPNVQATVGLAAPRNALPWPTGASLLAGETLQGSTTNLDPADQWDPPRYCVRELLEAQ